MAKDFGVIGHKPNQDITAVFVAYDLFRRHSDPVAFCGSSDKRRDPQTQEHALLRFADPKYFCQIRGPQAVRSKCGHGKGNHNDDGSRYETDAFGIGPAFFTFNRRINLLQGIRRGVHF